MACPYKAPDPPPGATTDRATLRTYTRNQTGNGNHCRLAPANAVAIAVAASTSLG